MQKLVTEVYQQLQLHPTKDILIGYSGGLDSTALLAILVDLKKHKPKLKIRAVHIHHGLNKNADIWVEHCQNVCAKFEVDLSVIKVQVAIGQGIEAGARIARYQAIAQLIRPNEILVTAHHLDDQVETFFLALKRGSSPQGLSGMQPYTTIFSVPVLRPLLSISRQELEQYVTEHKLTWIEDDSNQEDHYERNFLRNQVLPQLNQRWQYFSYAVARSAQYCAEQQQLLSELLAPDLNSRMDSQANLDISNFADYSTNRQKQLLRLWLSMRNISMPSSSQLQQILASIIGAKNDAQPELQLDNKIIRRFKTKLYITDKYQDIRHTVLLCLLQHKIILPDHLGELIFKPQIDGLHVDWAQGEITKSFLLPLMPNDAELRVQFSYQGTVKLTKNSASKTMKKLYQELAIPSWQRGRIPLVFYNQQLIAGLDCFIVQN